MIYDFLNMAQDSNSLTEGVWWARIKKRQPFQLCVSLKYDLTGGGFPDDQTLGTNSQ